MRWSRWRSWVFADGGARSRFGIQSIIYHAFFNRVGESPRCSSSNREGIRTPRCEAAYAFFRAVRWCCEGKKSGCLPTTANLVSDHTELLDAASSTLSARAWPVAWRWRREQRGGGKESNLNLVLFLIPNFLLRIQKPRNHPCTAPDVPVGFKLPGSVQCTVPSCTS